MKIIIIVPLFRMFLGVACVLEFMRFIVLINSIFVCKLYMVITLLRQLSAADTQLDNDISTVYTYITVSFKLTENTVDTIFGIFIGCGHVATIVLVWLSSKCWGLIPVFLSVCISIGALLFIIVSGALIPCAAKIAEDSQRFLRQKQALHFSSSRLNKRYSRYLKWKSHQLLGIKCGGLFLFQHSSTIDYFFSLLINVINSLLLIDP
ncbi:unnamed protein product [Orchesella dallaii]|uniref:Uncharacterized protein n=1 Tax=Orchesella dallaii TaxID=48710 RepID=A0ABP1QU92_9HEXA